MSNVIVVGCGRVGSQLANMLSDNGNNVCCIDKNADAFANLGRNFNGSTVQGVAFDEDVLIRAGVEECDVLAAVTQLDNTNLMCAEVANHLFGVPHVISRLYNPDHERAYMQLGIDYVCGTSLVAEDVFSKIVSGHGSHIDTFGEFECSGSRWTSPAATTPKRSASRNLSAITRCALSPSNAPMAPRPPSRRPIRCCTRATPFSLACATTLSRRSRVIFWIRWYPCTSLSPAEAKSVPTWLASC